MREGPVRPAWLLGSLVPIPFFLPHHPVKAASTLLGFFSFFLNFILFIYFIQQVLTSYLFYTYWCIYVNPNLPIHPTTITAPPTLLSPIGVHTFVLYMCVSILNL